MGELKTLNFTIGNNFDKIITSIAKEKALYDYDLEKALNVIKDSLVGIDEKLSFEILVGKMLLTTDIETQELICFKNPVDEAYKDFKLNKFYKELIFINFESKKILYYFKDAVFKNSRKQITVSIDVLSEYFLDNSNSEKLIEDVTSNYVGLKDFIAVINSFIDKSFKKITFYKTLKKKIIKLNLELPKELEQSIEIPAELVNLYRFIKNLPLKTILDNFAEITENKELDNYIKSAQEINNISKKGIQPVNILDNYSAGYLSQTGVYYGLNGDISNMLHNNLVDLMVEAGIIPEDFNGETSGDSYLERKGWVKQHGSWILYSGYDNSKLGGIDIPISTAQIKAIYEFGQLCCKGILKIGLLQTPISAAMWQMIDPVQFKLKWF